MTGLSAVLILSLFSQAASVSGSVIGADGKPVAGANVYAEQGLESALVSTTTGPDGAWRFDDVRLDNLGIFAIAPGMSFGGATVKPGEPTDGVILRLGRPETISGKAVDPKGHEIQGAQIVRIGLLGGDKVGIPLSKLKAAGIEIPASDKDGKFTISNLPAGSRVALKFAHADFANEAVSDVAVGDAKVKIVLNPGLLLHGDVKLRTNQQPVAGAVVWIRNAQPPHETASARTDTTGSFAARLKPGVYMCQASGAGMQSPGWTRLTLTGEDLAPKLSLYVANSGAIKGAVKDAKSGKGISGVSVELTTEGNMAAVARTDASGAFAFTAMAGENFVRINSAPGYLDPAEPAVKVQVPEAGAITLPDFWLAPSPSVPVQVLDADMKPVQGAAVSILRPSQFGLKFTDATGKINAAIAAWPQDGMCIGLVQHPQAPMGALFGLKRDTAEAKVQLFALGTVSGRVVDEKGNPMPGVAVAAMYDDSDITLWRTVTDSTGTYRWDNVIPNVPHRCVVMSGDVVQAQSEEFSIEPGGAKAVADIVGQGVAAGKSLLGAKLDISTGRGAVIYCGAADVAMVNEAVAALRSAMGPDVAVKVLEAPAPATATTYILDKSGTVVLETFGLPPLRLLKN